LLQELQPESGESLKKIAITIARSASSAVIEEDTSFACLLTRNDKSVAM
jgi:hypothetical protein